jgi:hypothetical protein
VNRRLGASKVSFSSNAAVASEANASADPWRRVIENKHSNRYRSMTTVRVDDHANARRRRRARKLDVGRLLVLKIEPLPRLTLSVAAAAAVAPKAGGRVDVGHVCDVDVNPHLIRRGVGICADGDMLPRVDGYQIASLEAGCCALSVPESKAEATS